MEILIETLNSLTEKCPDINIILRPHPGENILAWNKIFDKHKNIRVIQDQKILAAGLWPHSFDLNKLSYINRVLLSRKTKYKLCTCSE